MRLARPWLESNLGEWTGECWCELLVTNEFSDEGAAGEVVVHSTGGGAEAERVGEEEG